MAQRADDIKFEISSDGGTTYVDYTSILIELTPPSMERTMIDATKLTDTHKVYIPGSVESGEISAVFEFDEGDTKLWGTTGLVIEGNAAADSAVAFKLRISVPNSAAETAVWDAYLASSAIGPGTKDERATFSASFKLTGSATLS
jgi:hypothetical protein